MPPSVILQVTRSLRDVPSLGLLVSADQKQDQPVPSKPPLHPVKGCAVVTLAYKLQVDKSVYAGLDRLPMAITFPFTPVVMPMSLLDQDSSAACFCASYLKWL